MPLLGKANKSARNFLGSDAGQALLSTLSIFVPGDPYGFVQRRNREREQETAMQQQRNAIGGLLDQFQPDTQTPQVNELIGEANLAGRGRFDPMAQMQPKAPAFDFTSPQGQAALMNALGAGVSLDGISGLRDFLTPQAPERKLFNTRSGVVSVHPQTGEASEVYSDPYAEALAERQIDAQGALAEQRRASGRANMIRANRPPASGGGGGEAPAGPVATGRRF